MQLNKILFFLIFIPLVATLGFWLLLNQFEDENPFSEVSFLRDNAGQFHIGDIDSDQMLNRFITIDSRSINFGISEATYWLRVKLKEKFRTREHLVLVAGTPIIEFMSLYQPDSKGGYLTKHSGFAEPMKQRDFIYQKFVFDLQPVSDKPYYIRLKSRYSIQFIASIFNVSDFREYAIKTNLILGSLYGIIITMFLYNLLVYVFIRDFNNLSFALFLVGILVFVLVISGSTGLFITPAFGLWSTNHLVLWMSLVIATWTLFIKGVLNIRLQYPILNQFHRFVLFLTAILVCLTLVSQHQSIIYFSLFIAGLTTTVSFINLILGALKKERIAIFILIAFLPSTAGAFLNIPVYLGLSDSVFMAAETLAVGLAMSAVLFSLGLADQVNMIKEERLTYSTLLETKNSELLAYQNKLSGLVDDRTADLKTANIELQYKNLELELSRKQADMANLLKSEFLANISHELRTPMHQILGYARMGLKKLNTPRERTVDCFSNINSAGKRMMILLNDLLDLSKLESGKRKFIMRTEDMTVILSEIIDEFTIDIQNKKIQINFVKPETSTKLKCDGSQVGQLIRNLLMNAVRYTGDKGEIVITVSQKKLSTGICKGHSGLAVTFKDQGIGIPESELEMIFDKFTQSSRTKTGAGGTGLGLAISKEIVESHNGTIWAENNDVSGATISFILPIHQPVPQSPSQG